jgi:hypothetical protein
MKYLCLVFVDEKKLEALSPDESQALDDESIAYDETLRKNGHLLAAQALQPVKAAATVRIKNGKRLITDGPFAEAREQIGGFILIEARDLKEATQIASTTPVIRMGAIEVRPVMELTSSAARRQSR